MRATIAALALFGAVVFAGCELDDPTDDRGRGAAGPGRPVAESPGHSDDVASRVRAPESVRPEVGSRGASSPAEAASLYAATYSNWTWRNLDGVDDALAGLAAGELRRSERRDAHGLRADPTLAQQRLANRSEELALDLQGSAADTREAWVVLRETASARGAALPSDTRVTVYRMAVERGGDGRWYVTAFEPQG